MRQKVPIDRREHSLCVLGRVDEMRKDKQYCDFLIQVGSVEIHAHRNILAGGSEYFRAMFSHGTTEVTSGVVNMKGVDVECAIICIDHIYGRNVFVPDGKYEALMHCANLMQLHAICNGIVSLLENNLTPKLFVAARSIAKMYNLQKVKEMCHELADKEFPLIAKQDDFLELDKNFVKEMLQSMHAGLSEEEKLVIVLRWIKYDNERIVFSIEMLKTVLLSDVPLEFRRWLVENEQLVNGDIETSLLFYNSIIETEKRAKQKSAIAVFDKTSGHLQCFNPRVGSWKAMQNINRDLIFEGVHISAISIDNIIYILLSNKALYRLDYSAENAMWERLVDFIHDHGYYPPVTVLGNCIYVIGGHVDCSTKSVERYNPESNHWMELTEKTHSSMGSEILSSKGCIYSIGGTINGKSVNKVEKFNPVKSTWSELSPMRVARDYAAAVELNEKIFVFGGTCGLILDTVECYDVRTDEWTFLKSMNRPRWLFKAYAIDRKLYAVGGSWSPNSLEEYDVDADEWKMIELPTEMRLHIRESVEIKTLQ